MILEIQDVAFQYNSCDVLKEITFSVNRNEVLSILGPNGVGKTTLLKCMNTILRPQCGSIIIDTQDVLRLDRLAVAKKMGYVAQRSESGRLTAFDAILLGRRPHISWNVAEKDLKIVDAAIRRLDLKDLALRYIDEMSGGELQKVSIARAMVQEPRIFLLDEPTSSLDLKNQVEILAIIREIVNIHDASAVMTMHDLNLALRYSDRFLFLRNGVIYAAGGHEIITPETIEAVYGVPVDVEKYGSRRIVIPVG